jgi:Holliday junction resolvasome RuvABC endonuclease subunit
MTPMGAKLSASATTLDNAQFVGEIIGRLEEKGFRVVQLTKRQVLSALGIKGKAPATRVRKVVESLFGSLGNLTDHEVDAIAVAWAARNR